MAVERTIIGEFIDASIQDHAKALRLLGEYPDLREASWMGDEHLLNFLVIENFLVGVSFCLENGFNPNQPDGSIGTTPLHYACQLNYTDVARVLIVAGANPNAICQINENPIHCAVQNGNAELVDILIQHGADPDYITVMDETIFDNWPPWAEDELLAVIEKHNVAFRDEAEGE